MDLSFLRRASLSILALCIFFTLCSTVCAESNASSNSDMVTRYRNWMKRCGRRYKNNAELERRFAIYQENVQYIDYINSQNLTFKLTDNQFADMTNEEFIAQHVGFKMAKDSNATQSSGSGRGAGVKRDFPRSVNWVHQGAVNPSHNEEELQAIVVKQPVSAAIDSHGLAFQFYMGGIFSPLFCGLELNHGITIVGYGEDLGSKYWLVRNSWGKFWGESGYMKMARETPLVIMGTCGIAMKSSYPDHERHYKKIILSISSSTSLSNELN